jgi:hypothetical protein
VNCRANNRNTNKFESHTQRGYPRRPSETQRRSYNRFESLSTEVECYRCNNFGHVIAQFVGRVLGSLSQGFKLA